MLATIFATYTGLKILGGITIIIGVVIRYLIKRRKFNRKNWAGVELFKSYGRMHLISLLERFGGLIGLLLIIGGIVILALSIITKLNH